MIAEADCFGCPCSCGCAPKPECDDDRCVDPAHCHCLTSDCLCNDVEGSQVYADLEYTLYWKEEKNYMVGTIGSFARRMWENPAVKRFAVAIISATVAFLMELSGTINVVNGI